MALLHIHDAYFKAAFSRSEVAIDFLTSQLPAHVQRQLDLSKLTPSTNSFVDDTLNEHFADLVYECPYFQDDGSAASLRVALIFEHKSYLVRYPHFQLLRYLTNAWEADQKQGNAPRLIIPILIYHGEGTWQKVPMLDYFPGLSTDYVAFVPQFDYLFYDLSAMSDKQITGFGNRFLALSALLLKHSREKAYLQQIGERVRALILALQDQDANFLQSTIVYLCNTHNDKEQAQVFTFLRTISPQTTRLTMTIYESILKEGKIEGELKGKLEMQTATVRNMLRAKKLSIQEIADYAGVSEAFVQDIQRQLPKK